LKGLAGHDYGKNACRVTILAVHKLKYGVHRNDPRYDRRRYKDPKYLAKQKHWVKANQQKVYGYRRKYRAKDPEKWRKYYREQKQRWKKTHPESFARSIRHHSLMRRCGMTLVEYEQRLKKQRNRCAICQTKHKEEKGKRLQADHCHKTGRKRGLLCGACNSMLGYGRDNVAILKAAIKYLRTK
jgi:hypothetical protein